MPDQPDTIRELEQWVAEAEQSQDCYQQLFVKADLERKRLLLDNMRLKQEIVDLKYQIAHINDQRYKFKGEK